MTNKKIDILCHLITNLQCHDIYVTRAMSTFSVWKNCEICVTGFMASIIMYVIERNLSLTIWKVPQTEDTLSIYTTHV